MKDPVRMLEKINHMQVPQVRYVQRASILCTSAAQVRATVEGLLRDLDEVPDMTVFDDGLATRIVRYDMNLATDVHQAKRKWLQLADLGDRWQPSRRQ